MRCMVYCGQLLLGSNNSRRSSIVVVVGIAKQWCADENGGGNEMSKRKFDGGSCATECKIDMGFGKFGLE